MSDSLAYVLGVLDGDGFIGRSNKYTHAIGLNTTEQPFAQSFFHALKAIGLNPHIHLYSPSRSALGRKKQWRTIAHNKQFGEWYLHLSKKDKNEIIERYPIPYIRGFYESEGSCWKHQSYGRIGIVNTNIPLLEKVRQLIRGLGFHPSSIHYNRNPQMIGVFHIDRKAEVENFIKVVNPTVKRGEY